MGKTEDLAVVRRMAELSDELHRVTARGDVFEILTVYGQLKEVIVSANLGKELEEELLSYVRGTTMQQLDERDTKQ